MADIIINIMNSLFRILMILFIGIGMISCEIKDDSSVGSYMNDSTLTHNEKKELAIQDHLKSNPIIFNMVYKNSMVPSIVDDFTSLDVIEMNYDSMVYLIVRSKYNNDRFEIINVSKDKVIIEYYKNTSVIKAEQIRTKEENKSLFGTDITKGYFDREN